VLKNRGDISTASAISNRADQFVERVKYHAHTDGSLDEQIDRYTGQMTSAHDLTWNYAALLTTRHAAVH
jgi:GH15 family glucan-1,4-alpha-glucosidase